MKINFAIYAVMMTLTSCASGEFSGSAETDQLIKKCKPSQSDDCKKPKKLQEEPLTNTTDDPTNEPQILTGTCKYLDLTAELDGFLIPGGPPIKLKPSDLSRGHTEGDTLFLNITAYQGPAGAGGAKTNRLYAASLNGDGSIKDPAKFKQWAPHIIPASFAATGAWHSANEWTLKAFPLKGGQVPVAIKHEYRIQVKGVDSENCQASAHPVTQPYYSRGPNAFNPQSDIDTGGCFSLSTRITMADGTEKLAANIQKGDLLLNPLTKKATQVSEVVFGPEEANGLVEIRVDDKSVHVTTQHPFETKRGLKAAAELTLDDEILVATGKYKKITIIRTLPLVKNQKVINFVVASKSKKSSDHMLLANGIITGDLYLQRQLSKISSIKKDISSQVLARNK